MARLAVLAALVSTAALALAPAEGSFPGPNGRIVFVQAFTPREFRPGIAGLYSAKPGGSRQQLTSRVPVDGDPAVSADGRRIAFVRANERGRTAIFVMRANGGGVRRITGFARNARPAWAPDGRRLLVVRGGAGVDRPRLWVVRLSDGRATRLTREKPGDPLDEESASWSPDGKTIAVGRTRDFSDPGACGGPTDEAPDPDSPPDCRRTGIWLVSARGEDVRHLAGGLQPEWHPDGDRLVFTSAGAIRTVAADGTAERRVLSVSAARPGWSPDGRLIYWSDERRTAVLGVAPSGGRARTLVTKAFNATWGRRPR